LWRRRDEQEHPDWLEVRRGEAPLVVSIPHGGVDLREYEQRFVSPWLARKDADWRLDELYDFVESLGATLIRTRLSRSIIDVNRDRAARRSRAGDDRTVPDDDLRRRAALPERCAKRGGDRRSAGVCCASRNDGSSQ
jgi:N-formylglutamate amidohydrolase